MEILNKIIENWDTITLTVFAGITLAEGLVRITPTKKDDGAVERAGKFLKRLMDIIKIPNNIKK